MNDSFAVLGHGFILTFSNYLDIGDPFPDDIIGTANEMGLETFTNSEEEFDDLFVTYNPITTEKFKVIAVPPLTEDGEIRLKQFSEKFNISNKIRLILFQNIL